MSSEIAISVENLGKMYRIGAHQARAKNLREVLQRAATSSFRYLHTRLRQASEAETLWALRGVSFEVNRGEVLGVIGRNGAGKSTLLKILSRITDPTEGRAIIRGRVNSLLEVGTGFHPELTGRENIYLSAAIYGMRKAEIDRKFDEIVAFSELDQFVDTPVKRYSSGMYVRLAFGVAAHLEPEILIVDEVLAVGDAAFQSKCLGKMQDVAKTGRTVLFVSHNLQALSTLCSRAILLERGQKIAEGLAQPTIDAYLRTIHGDASKQEPVRSYARNEAKEAQILDVRIEGQDGKPSLKHNLMDTITVEFGFEVRRPLANVIACCHICSETSQILCVTTEADWANFQDGSKILECPKDAGQYRARFTLQAPFLNAGRYELALFLFHPKVKIFDSVRSLVIELHDTDSFASCILQHRRSGFFLKPLAWEVHRK